MNQISSTGQSTFGRNLTLLKQQQPRLAERLANMQDDDSVRVLRSRDALPIPILNNVPLHSQNDPVSEGWEIAQMIEKRLQDPAWDATKLPPQRLMFFGFGFGYHLMPLVRRGWSLIVVEPSVQVLWQAFHHLDMSEILPFIQIYVVEKQEDLPDIPRLTQVFFHPTVERLFPQLATALSQKIIVDYPARTSDIHEGVYYGAYHNVTCLKNPVDFFAYQMLFYLVRPTLVIEIGACRGGSALYFADLLRSLGGERRIYTFDIVHQVAPEVLEDPNSVFNSQGWQAFDPAVIKPNDRVMVIEDSSHTYENTIQVMRHFAQFVSPNSYLIVEDGESGYTRPEFNGGAIRAIEEFLQENDDFILDRRWEFLYGNNVSENLKGYLRRKVNK